MREAYPHLHASIRGAAEEEPNTRIRRIRTDRWVSYARAEAALTAMDDLLNFPKRTRMPNLLLVGPTNNGKTMIVEKFRRAHPAMPASQTESGAAHIPVLRVQMQAEVHASGSNLVQQRLPQVCAAPVDQLDLRRAAFAILVAESGGQLQAACASADDEDLLRGLARGGLTAVLIPHVCAPLSWPRAGRAPARDGGAPHPSTCPGDTAR